MADEAEPRSHVYILITLRAIRKWLETRKRQTDEKDEKQKEYPYFQTTSARTRLTATPSIKSESQTQGLKKNEKSCSNKVITAV